MSKSRIPQKVDGYRSEVINALIDCVTMLWPKRSATLLINPSASGCGFEVKRPGSGGGAAPFSGTAYVAGNKTTGLGTKDWVRCFLDTGTAEDNDGPAPNPFPYREEWYEVAYTHGDIHIPRA